MPIADAVGPGRRRRARQLHGRRARRRIASRSALVVIVVAGLIALGVPRPGRRSVRGARPAVRRPRPDVAARRRRPDAAARGGRLAAEADERALRETRGRASRAAAAEERRRCARELHDVVAHGVSVMVIQAGAARQVVRTVAGPGRGGAARGRGDRPRGDGRAAAVPRRPRATTARRPGLAPQPGIDQLGALVDRVREAGLPATLEVDGAPRPLPASLDVTVYRIVQEALTNALRYARRAATLVRAELGAGPAPGRDPRRRARPTAPTRPKAAGGASSGCASARSLVGGRLEAGPRLGGGYAVRAWLPLEPRDGTGSDGVTDRLRVLIADDQALVRAGFRMILEAQPDIEVVAEAADGEAAVRLARRLRPDVVLMDVRMPGLDGLEATRRLLGRTRRRAPAPPRIVILTTFDLDEYVYAALQAGRQRASCSRTSRRSTSSAPSGPCRSATRCSRRRSPAGSSSGSPGRRRRSRSRRRPLATPDAARDARSSGCSPAG